MDANLQQPPVKLSWLNRPIPPALRMYGGIWLAVISSLCVPLVFVIPRHYAACLYALIACSALALLPAKRLNVIRIIAAVLVVLAVVLIARDYFTVKTTPRAVEVINLTRSIQLALNRYADDHDGHFPADIETLRTKGYLPRFPENVYANKWAMQEGLPADSHWQEMHQVGAEAFTENLPLYLEGNFIYLPDVCETETGSRYACDYILLGLAKGRAPVKDNPQNKPLIFPVILYSSKLDKPMDFYLPQ